MRAARGVAVVGARAARPLGRASRQGRGGLGGVRQWRAGRRCGLVAQRLERLLVVRLACGAQWRVGAALWVLWVRWCARRA